MPTIIFPATFEVVLNSTKQQSGNNPITQFALKPTFTSIHNADWASADNDTFAANLVRIDWPHWHFVGFSGAVLSIQYAFDGSV